jgi:hypothetical protein
MDSKQFKSFTDEWKRRGALDFTRKSHYETMAPLFEAHAEVVEVTAADFHNLGTQGDTTTYYPKKETIDKFGAAAGLSFSSVNIGTRKESPLCYVGRAQCEMLGPDGQIIHMVAAESEYDAETRSQEEILLSIKKWGDKSKFKGPNAEVEKELCLLAHKKKARAQCDTGARTRAIIAAIGMSTGFKNLFSKGPTVYFLFSRIIYNAKNKMVMDRALDSMFGAAKLLGGPSISDEVIPYETNEDNLENIRNVTNDVNVDDLAEKAVTDELEGVDEAFGPTPQSVLDQLLKDKTPRSSLRYVRLKYENYLSSKVKGIIDPYLEADDTPDEKFIALHEQAKNYLEKKGIEI